MISIANNCSQLKHLCISNCKHLTDLSLIALGKQTNDLYVFESSGCSNFTDAGFIALSKVQNFEREINKTKKSSNFKITFFFIKGCPNLVRLDLEECSRVTWTYFLYWYYIYEFTWKIIYIFRSLTWLYKICRQIAQT